MPSSFIIIGAGLSGPTAALRLAQDGHTCTIYERTAKPQTIGGAVNLAPNGMRLLSRLGLRDAISARGCRVPAFELFDERGAMLGAFPSRSRDGFDSVRIMRGALQAVLLEECARQGVAVHFDKRLASITEREDGDADGRGVIATFADGSTAESDFLIGADGIHSAVRQTYVAPSTTPAYAKQTIAYGILPTSRLPDVNFARMPLTAGVFARAGFFAAAFTDERRTACYWIAVKTADVAEKTYDADKIRADAMEMFGGLYDPIPRIIAATDDFFSWPVYELPVLEQWHRGRVVLVGDAAHALPPNQGQGVSQAVEDVFGLARTLKAVEKGAKEEAMRRYEDLRKPRVEKLRATVRKQTREHKRGPWAQWLVTWSFWAFLKVLATLSYVWEWDQFSYDVDTSKI